MVESRIHLGLVLGVFGLAAITAAVLCKITAPYGRHDRAGWGPRLQERLGWILMESPAVVLYLAIYARGEHRLEVAPLVLLGLWQLHYVHRTFVYPFRMRGGGRSIPWVVVLVGFGFNVLNAYVNARWISELGRYPGGWLTDGRFVTGAALFLTGFVINLRADSVLLGLRKPGEGGHKMPRGGLHEVITCPNYFGEIVEWVGWAVATWSPAGLAFAVYTMANLAPRALAHRRWYRERFPDYPPGRRALIPYVF